MYNIRLSLIKATLHRINSAASHQQPPLRQRSARGEGWGGVYLPVVGLIAIDVLLFALVIIRILESRGG